jgi:DNA invertase Pin-like site-specific DNA recombinase
MKVVACYVRTSPVENTQAKQKRAIGRWLKSSRISPKSIRWYVDKPAKDPSRRPQFEALQADIAGGRVRAVVVWHLSRLCTTTREGLSILGEWCEKPLRVVSVDQKIDIKTRDCGTIASVLRGVIEMDEETRRERTEAGLASARARGRVGGRPRLKGHEARVLKAKKLRNEQSLSIGEICKRLKISRSTYYRYMSL